MDGTADVTLRRHGTDGRAGTVGGVRVVHRRTDVGPDARRGPASRAP